MVGLALDTNGQKRRFVEAARRWGDDPEVTRALIAGEWEGAGIPVRFAIAAEKSEGLAIRSAHKATAYFEFPADITWSRSTNAEVQRLADEADLIHLTNDVKAYYMLKQTRLRKPALLHHHGTLFRNNPARLLREGERFHMLQAVSTIDLLQPAPDMLHWLPAPIDMDEMATIRQLNRRPDDGLVRIVSAPTNRQWKSTDALEAAVRQLQAEGLPVELGLVEGRTWAECLTVKATADIYFDQVLLGYGCNAIEAWGMGIPVVAGADEWTLARMRKEWNLGKKPMPFHEASESTITHALRELVKSPDLRAKVAARGMAHAAKYHAEKPALARLAELYSMAMRKMAAAPDEVVEDFPLGPGTFQTDLPRLRVRISNQVFDFADHRITITDPRFGQRMRQVARHQPRFQISEVA